MEIGGALPSDDPRWRDLSEGRGDDATRVLLDHFRIRPAGHPLHVLFASHRGAGKTTELNRLAAELRDRFFSLYFDAHREMDIHRIDPEDLLLVLAERVEARLREEGRPLPSKLLDEVHKWFLDVVRTTRWGAQWSADLAAGFEVKAEVPLLARLLASLKLLFRAEGEQRSEVKDVLRKYTGSLGDSVNARLGAANARLAEEGRELLVIVDTLDRYRPDVVDPLLVGAAERIRGLRCHLILTPPIGLIYQPESEPLEDRYPCEVMNTVRLRRPDQPFGQFDGPGRGLMLEVLRARLDVEALIPDETVVDRLIAASGGATRDLMRFVSDAALRATGATIDHEVVERVLRRRRSLVRDRINLSGWAPALARIHQTKQVSRAEDMTLLYQRFALKYDDEGWYDIHPLVADVPEFRRELEGAAGGSRTPE